MSLSTKVTKLLNIEHPIVQAPMAGGATTPELVAAVSNAGGLGSLGAGYTMDGRGLAAALMLGAEAVQMGTAFLTTKESGAHPEYKKAVLGASGEDTAVTRVFSGKLARGIKNRFLLEMDEHDERLPPYPVQNAWTKDIRNAAQEQDRPELMSLWAGQASRLGRSQPAAKLVERVVAETNTVLQRDPGQPGKSS